MEEKSGAQISARAFLQSVAILVILMLLAGILTRVIPSGAYTRINQGDRQVIDPQSFQYTPAPAYPIWRWLTAPLEVLWGPDALILITIIVFILMVGGAFAVLDRSGILSAALGRVVKTFGARKYLLLLVITLFFMAMGAFFGLFEEVVPLVPLMVALAYSLGWDVLVGLGMSILATNMGFSAAMTNPFSIGVAQRLAGLPLFSGLPFRFLVFLAVYAVMAVFLVRYAQSIERDPSKSLVHGEDESERRRFSGLRMEDLASSSAQLGRAGAWFGVCLLLIVAALFASPFVPFLTSYSLPLVGLLFFAGGLGAGLISGTQKKAIWKALGEGMGGIAPGIPLILMAASIKHIVTNGQIIDTILHSASLWLRGTTPLAAALLIYALALLIEVFIASAGAKAVLMMPILLPLADLIGVTRQVAVTAYCFGDGFSNLAYPTNPVLLIVLGLAGIRYSKWLRWTGRLWFVVVPVTVIFLWIAVGIKLGPF